MHRTQISRLESRMEREREAAMGRASVELGNLEALVEEAKRDKDRARVVSG